MKYPKWWQGEDVHAHSRMASSAERGNYRIYGITVHVYRPGTPHHTRRVIADLTRDQLVALDAAIKHQLALGQEEPE
jgi:hypothetical protein